MTRLFNPSPKLNVYASNPETHEVWCINQFSAIADIRSELSITEEEALTKLIQSNSDSPVKLKEVEFWIE